MATAPKNKIDIWIYENIELIELFIISYVKTSFGIIFSPRKTLTRLMTSEEKISPIVYFIFNIFIVVVDGKTFKGLFESALKNVLLTAKPTWDTAFIDFISYIIGLLAFIMVFRFVERKPQGNRTPTTLIFKSITYASFTFLPVVLLNQVIYFILNFRYTAELWHIMITPEPSRFVRLLVFFFSLWFIHLCWWSYLVYCALHVYSPYSNFKLVKYLSLTLALIGVISVILPCIRDYSKLVNSISLIQSTIEYKDELKKPSPDYLHIGMILWSLSKNDTLPPYERYKSSVKSTAYLMTFLKNSKSIEGLKYVELENYDAIEKLFSIDITNIPPSIPGFIQTTLKDNVVTATAQKKLPGFIITNEKLFIPFFGVHTEEEKSYINLLP